MKALYFILIILFLLFFVPTCSANIFTNPSFESGTLGGVPTGWSPMWAGYHKSSDSPYDGSYCAKSNSTALSGISQSVDLTGIDTICVYAHTTQATGRCILHVDGLDAYHDNKYTWTLLCLNVSSKTGTHSVQLRSNNKVAYYDNIYVPTYKLSGYVENNLGNSVSSATITLNNSGGSTTSNDTGYYEISDISSGTYSITATSPTNEDYSDTVSITADTEKNITMTRLTPTLSNVGIIDSSESTLRIGWKENAVVDSVRIYQGTNTNLIATKDTAYVSLASYTVGNLDTDAGYNFWLEPWDGAISGSKYYVSGTTEGDGGGGGGGGDPTPTATGTPGPTPGPTAPPYTNYTDEDWLNFTRYEQEYILFEHDQLNTTIGTYTPKAVNLSFWYLILFLGICSTAYGSQKKNGEILFTCGLVAVVISMIKLGLF